MARSRKQADRSVGFLAMLIMAVFLGCQPKSDGDSPPKPPAPTVEQVAEPASGPPQSDLFRDVTTERGIDFVHRPVVHEQQYFMPRSVGSGVALLDFDNDGRLDLYFVQNSGPDPQSTNRLYRQTDHGFVDVTAGSGTELAGMGMGVAAGDIDNDGRVDLILNEYGRAVLLHNQSQGEQPRFVDVSESAGIDNRLWGTSTCFVDYDRDGWLDIVLVNYVNYDPSRWCADGGSHQDFCGPDNFPGRVTKLLRNLGGDGKGIHFADQTVASGLGAQPGPGLGVFCADFDGDRWPDIFIANDGKPNHLWVNQRDGTFKEEATTRGLGYNSMGKTEANMGIAIGDVDQDGQFDIFVTHLSDETHTLWSQGPRGVFMDRTATTGLTATKWRGTGFGTVMYDVDNDGDLDLMLANGRVTRESGPLPEFDPTLDKFWHPYAQRDQILLNRGTGSFVDASLENRSLCGLASVSRGMACGDLNNDGRLDMVVTHIDGRPSLLENVADPGLHWLLVRAIDPRLKRDAYGAEVYVQSGERQLMRWINPGYSFLCSNDPRAHFGLGTQASFESVRIVWPDGLEEVFPGGTADRQLVLERGTGQAAAAQPPGGP